MKNKNFKLTLVAGLLLATVGVQFSGCKKGAEDPFLSLRSRKARLTGEWTVSSFAQNGSYEATYDNDPQVDDERIAYSSMYSMTFNGSSIEESSSYVNTYDGTGFYDEESNERMASGSTYEEKNTTKYTDNTSDIYTVDGDYASSANMTYTFNSDGTFTATSSMSQSYTRSETETGYTLDYTSTESSTSTISGTWSFIDGNKSDEFKNKERIALWYKSVSEVYVSEAEWDFTDTDATDFWNYNNSDESESDTSEDTYTYDDTDSDEMWELVMLSNKEMQVTGRYSYSGTGSYTSEQTYYDGSSTITSQYESNSNYTSTGTIDMTLTQE